MGNRKMTNPLRMDMKKGAVELEHPNESDEEIFEDDQSDDE